MGKGDEDYSVSLNLPVFELDRSEPTENRNGNFELAAVGVDFVDAAGERGEGSVADLHLIANRVLDFRDFLAIGRLDAGVNLINLGLTECRGAVAANETDDARDFLHEIPRTVDDLALLIVETHLDEDVTRIEFPNFRALLAVLDLGDDLGGQEDGEDRVIELLGLFELLDVVPNLV